MKLLEQCDFSVLDERTRYRIARTAPARKNVYELSGRERVSRTR